jgi:hypothetical protein
MMAVVTCLVTPGAILRRPADGPVRWKPVRGE